MYLYDEKNSLVNNIVYNYIMGVASSYPRDYRGMFPKIQPGMSPKIPYEIKGFQNMSTNPIDKFMAGFSNESVCNWFFFMYILALLSALFQFSYILYTAFTIKNKLFGFTISIVSGVALSIAVLQSLFLYSLCDRSIVNRV